MPMYEFYCESCDLLEEFFHKMDDDKKEHDCPKCSEKMVRKFCTNFAVKDGPSGIAPTKALREKNYRAQRSEEMKKKQKDNHWTPTLQPNVQNKDGKVERFDSWKEAQSFAKSEGKNTKSYDPLISKEKKGS